EQGTDLVLVAPVWLSQSWYLRLLGLLTSYPLRINDFQEKLQTSSCPLGGKKPISPMTQCVKDGSAGVLKGS
uniref:Uncharacterized protein n=1 Tax=Amphimedon queenslandica TaxID=400682 RepID=A0A1X7V324_AMPQE